MVHVIIQIITIVHMTKYSDTTVLCRTREDNCNGACYALKLNSCVIDEVSKEQALCKIQEQRCDGVCYNPLKYECSYSRIDKGYSLRPLESE